MNSAQQESSFTGDRRKRHIHCRNIVYAMKLSFVVIPVFCCLLLLAGCGGGGEANSSLIGKWKIVEATGTADELNKGTIYSFVDEANVEISGLMMTNKGTYTRSGRTVKMSFTFPGPVTITGLVKIKGNRMSLELANSDQKFVLERQ